MVLLDMTLTNPVFVNFNHSHALRGDAFEDAIASCQFKSKQARLILRLLHSHTERGNNLTLPCPRYQQGFTLLEVILVILIIAIASAIILPQLSSSNPYKLEAAAQEVVAAIRFARSESIRKKEPVGIWYYPLTQSLSVFRVVYVLGLPVPYYDIRHPVDKKLYSLNFSANGNQSPAKISSVTLKFGGNATNRFYISFDANGSPFYWEGANYQMLDNASIVLEYGGQTRTINISPMTGRVTLL